MTLLYWLAGWYLLTSLIAFTIYGVDKRSAKRGTWRIKERTLHILELIGGWPGALIAQHVFHHKSRKTKYQLVFWGIVTLHLFTWAGALYSRWR